MLDLSTNIKRYLPVKINGVVFELEPPKLKTTRKFTELSKKMSDTEGKITDDQITELSELVCVLLSKNKKSQKVDIDFVEENLDLESMIVLIEHYADWIGGIQSDPN